MKTVQKSTIQRDRHDSKESWKNKLNKGPRKTMGSNEIFVPSCLDNPRHLDPRGNDKHLLLIKVADRHLLPPIGVIIANNSRSLMTVYIKSIESYRRIVVKL